MGIKPEINGERLQGHGEMPTLRVAPYFSGHKGFTLIEMILVMVIAIMLLGAVGPRVAAGIGSMRFRASAQEIASALRYVRAKAVSEERETALTINLDDHVYDVDGGEQYSIPEEVDIDVYTTTAEVYGNNQAGFIFYPDGSASGGRITLEYHGQKRLIYINWLTGLVEVLEQRQ